MGEFESQTDLFTTESPGVRARARDRIRAHDMPLTPGTWLGPYEIESLIGSGVP